MRGRRKRGVLFANFLYKSVGVADVTVVNGAPCSSNDVITFSWVACVCADCFTSESDFVPAQHCYGSNRLVAQCIPYGCGSSCLTSQSASCKLSPEVDFLFGRLSVGFVVKVGVFSEGGQRETVVVSASCYEIVELTFVVVVAVEMVPY